MRMREPHAVTMLSAASGVALRRIVAALLGFLILATHDSICDQRHFPQQRYNTIIRYASMRASQADKYMQLIVYRTTLDKKLSYRRDSAGQRLLRRSRSFKVTDLGTSGKPLCDFPL